MNAAKMKAQSEINLKQVCDLHLVGIMLVTWVNAQRQSDIKIKDAISNFIEYYGICDNEHERLEAAYYRYNDQAILKLRQ